MRNDMMIAAAIAQGLGLNVLQFIKHTKTDQNNSAGSKSIIYDLDVKGTRLREVNISIQRNRP
jgi:hypothetical protein